jgi:hypothetical protein
LLSFWRKRVIHVMSLMTSYGTFFGGTL